VLAIDGCGAGAEDAPGCHGAREEEVLFHVVVPGVEEDDDQGVENLSRRRSSSMVLSRSRLLVVPCARSVLVVSRGRATNADTSSHDTRANVGAGCLRSP
jgi:hypothetical protein